MRTAVCVLLLSLMGCATTTDFRGSRPPDAQDFVYSTAGKEDVFTESLTNPIAINLTPIPKGTTNVVVGYKRVHDRGANTVRVFRTDARREANAVTLTVTDVATNEVVFTRRLQDDTGGGSPTLPSGDVNACIAAFMCEHSSKLQCEANRTCQPQGWGLICPISPTVSISVHGVIRPNSLRCTILDHVVDFEGLVFSQE
jgi:hypothetical protein